MPSRTMFVNGKQIVYRNTAELRRQLAEPIEESRRHRQAKSHTRKDRARCINPVAV